MLLYIFDNQKHLRKTEDAIAGTTNFYPDAVPLIGVSTLAILIRPIGTDTVLLYRKNLLCAQLILKIVEIKIISTVKSNNQQ